MMTIKEVQEELIEEFEYLTDWEEKYQQLIKMGKDLTPFPEELRTEKNKVHGCQSQVWMNAELESGKVNINADSDAVIVKGLIGILLKVYSGRTPEDIISSPPEFLSKIGIDKHLSPTRKNGLSAMLKQIQLYAVAFKAMEKNNN